MTPRVRTLVVGGYGYGNVGDEAILAGLLTRIGTDGVTVVSRDPAETRRTHGVDAVDHAHAAVALGRHRSMIIGGGGLFGPDMGRIGRLLPAFGIGAALLRKRVTVEGVDVEDSSGWLVAALLRRAQRVTVRDSASRSVAARMGVDAEVAPDLSALMAAAPATSGRSWLATSGIGFERPVIGLALTGVRRDLGPAVLAASAEVMDVHPDADFVFIPMSRHPRIHDHDDLRLARALRERQPRLRIVEEPAHPAVILAAYGHLSAVVAMRYHGMVFAQRMGVPLVPIPYAEKNRRWLSERGISEVAPTSADLDAALRRFLAREPALVAS